MPSRTCRSVSTLTVCRMISSSAPVKPQMISSVAMKSCVRSRKRQGLPFAAAFPGINLYPAPWMVRKNRGFAESGSSFCRKRKM